MYTTWNKWFLALLLTEKKKIVEHYFLGNLCKLHAARIPWIFSADNRY